MKKETDLYIECECGRELPVKKTDAGGSVVCECGKRNVVPTLSRLRKNVGLDGIELSVGDRILAKIEDGELPGPQCLACNSGSTATVVRVFAECERSTTTTTGGFDWTLLLTTVLLPVTIFSWGDEEHETKGRDTVIPIHLGFCHSCQGRIPRFFHFAPLRLFRIVMLIGFVITLVTGHHFWPYFLGAFLALGVGEFALRLWNQANCKSLMQNDDDYAKLLDEFPDASITE